MSCVSVQDSCACSVYGHTAVHNFFSTDNSQTTCVQSCWTALCLGHCLGRGQCWHRLMQTELADWWQTHHHPHKFRNTNWDLNMTQTRAALFTSCTLPKKSCVYQWQSPSRLSAVTAASWWWVQKKKILQHFSRNSRIGTWWTLWLRRWNWGLNCQWLRRTAACLSVMPRAHKRDGCYGVFQTGNTWRTNTRLRWVRSLLWQLNGCPC